jgi:2-desacetyl-2-hydroxyethyl bacteriochlorophyllide A dehydrogenase
MRQLVFHGPRRLAVEETEPPSVGPDEVRVEVRAVGVCGSDVHGYAGVNSRRVPGMVMGHEAVGVVAEAGERVEGLAVGTPVTIDPIVGCGECEYCHDGEENVCERRRIYGCALDLPGAYADSIVVRAANAVRYDGPAPLEWGALVEPLAVGARAARFVPEVAGGKDVLVVGGGPIGLGAALAARRRGAARVVVSEPLAHRRAVAGRLELETIDPASEDVPRSAFPLALECVGHSATLASALNAVRPRGVVVFVGLAEETIDLPTTPLMVGERRIVGSAAYSSADFRDTAGWIASADEDLSPLIEERVDLDGLPAVFEAYAEGSLHAVKTLYEPPGAG